MELVVVRIGAEWSILTKGRKRGRYSYEVDAVEAALRMAADLRPRDPGVEVIVQDRFGELRRLERPAAAPAR